MLVAKGARSAFLVVGEHPVHFYRVDGRGRGAPIVLVHGLGGSAHGFYKTLFLLCRRFSTVYALDLPGSGFSPVPAGGPLSLVEQLEVLRGFLIEAVGRPAFVVGNSLGGAMSVALANAAPERVRALGLVAPAGARVEEHRAVEMLSALNVRDVAGARALARRLFHRPPLLATLFASQLLRMYGSPAVRRVLSERPLEFLPPEWLKALAMPTLLLWGKSEKVLPFEGVDYFRAHLPPHAEIHVVDGFGHVPQMEHPDKLVDHLVRFADRHAL